MNTRTKVIYPTYKSFLELMKDESRIANKYEGFFCSGYSKDNRIVLLPVFYLDEYDRCRDAEAKNKMSINTIKRRLERQSIRFIQLDEMKAVIINNPPKVKSEVHSILDGTWTTNKENFSMLLTVIHGIRRFGKSKSHRIALTGTSDEFGTHKTLTVFDSLKKPIPILKKYEAYGSAENCQ